jgi:hypothetical protein
MTVVQNSGSRNTRHGSQFRPKDVAQREQLKLAALEEPLGRRFSPGRPMIDLHTFGSERRHMRYPNGLLEEAIVVAQRRRHFKVLGRPVGSRLRLRI